MRRINVIGTSCSGKTTLARDLATRLNVRHVELDALFWDRSWTPVPAERFRSRLAGSLTGDAWVADGGYAAVRDITWARADTVVWLDYSLPVVLARWARRTVHRIRSGEEFWPGTGNRETVRRALARDGLLRWILRTHRARRRRTSAAMATRPELRWIRLRSPAETAAWLATVEPAQRSSVDTTDGASASAQNP